MSTIDKKKQAPKTSIFCCGRLYMRKWKIVIFKPAYKTETVTNKEGITSSITSRDTEKDIAVDVSLLRCVFKTNATVQTQAAVCTLEVYNMNSAAEGDIIREGFQISIEGGYQEGQYGEIFTGDIVQVIRNRENGTDYKLEIIAMRGIALFNLNFTKCSIAAKSTPRDTLEAVAKNARKPIEVGEISPNLTMQQLPRGKVIFCEPDKCLRNIAIGNNAYYWAGEDNKLTVKKVADEIPEGEVLELTPTTGLIGTPQYGDDGIHIKMLLDNRVKLLSMVKIDNELIRRQLLTLNVSGQGGNNKLAQQNQFDQDGEYQMFSVSHHGDTHGDDWSTEVIGIGRLGRGGLLLTQTNKEQPTS